MDASRWQRLVRIYNAVQDLEANRRSGYLAEACEGDPALRVEIDTLLANREAADRWLEQPALDVVAKAIAEDEAQELGEGLTGKTMLHYRLLEEIGAGGMGVVYRAHDTRLNRPVAIKLLPNILLEDKQSLARFEREALMMASISHPAIAGIHGLEEADSGHFLVLEWIAGKTLAERLQEQQLTLDETLRICLHIAEGLEAAHTRGVIHRDLKPQNIKITPDGDVKILDFGLAKPLRTEPPEATPQERPAKVDSLTCPGLVFGTPAYMSPEQALGQAVDETADIWAFGCLLYECLTGRRAFLGSDFSTVRTRVLQAEPDWNLLPESTPAAIRMLVQRCLQKAPERRLHKIADARKEISAFVARPASKESRNDRKYVTIPRTILLALAALLLVLVASVISLLALNWWSHG